VDVPSSETRGRTTSISERPLKVPTVIIDDKNDATTSQKHEGPPESTQSYLHQSTPQNLVVPSLGNIPSVVQGTDDVDIVTTPLHGNVLIPEANAPSQQAPPDVTEEPQGTENVLSESSTGTSVPSGEKGLLKGKAGFRFAFACPHSAT